MISDSSFFYRHKESREKKDQQFQSVWKLEEDNLKISRAAEWVRKGSFLRSHIRAWVKGGINSLGAFLTVNFPLEAIASVYFLPAATENIQVGKRREIVRGLLQKSDKKDCTGTIIVSLKYRWNIAASGEKKVKFSIRIGTLWNLTSILNWLYDSCFFSLIGD